MYPAFAQARVFYVNFGFGCGCDYDLAQVMFGESFKSPLEQGFVDDWEEDFGSAAAERS